MKYIVCNTEQSVFNRVYDELERYIEPGAVFSFSEKILDTQFSKRIIEEHKNGKYSYKHIIFLGQKEISGIEKEEDVGFYRIMKRNFYKPLDVDYKNIFSPEYINEKDINKYKEIIDDNKIDVALIFLDKNGYILNYNEVTKENEDVHLFKISKEKKQEIKRKYNIDAKSDKIITIGYDCIMKANNIFLIAIGEDKKDYVKKLFDEEEDKSILTLIKKHKNLVIFTDKNASYKKEIEVDKMMKERKRKKELEEKGKSELRLKENYGN